MGPGASMGRSGAAVTGARMVTTGPGAENGGAWSKCANTASGGELILVCLQFGTAGVIDWVVVDG